MDPQLSLGGLTAFAAVMRTGSVTNASKQLDVPASTVSRRLSELERELELPLFARTASGMTPTEAATQLAPTAEKIIGQLFAIKQHAERLQAGTSSNPIRILTFQRCGDALLAPAFAEFCGSSADPSVVIETQMRRHLVKAVDLNDYHLTVTTQLSVREPIWHLLGRVPLVIVVSKDDELARFPSVRLEDLDGRRMVQLAHGTLMRHVADELFAMTHAQPAVAIETSSSTNAIQLATAGVGFFLVDALVPMPFWADCAAAIPLDNPFTVDVVAKTSEWAQEMPEIERLQFYLSEQIAAINQSFDRALGSGSEPCSRLDPLGSSVPAGEYRNCSSVAQGDHGADIVV